MTDRITHARQAWHDADGHAQLAEQRLSRALQVFEETGTPVPAGLAQEVSAARNLANGKLTTLIMLMRQGARVPP